MGRSTPGHGERERIQLMPAAASSISQGWEQLASVETSPKPAVSWLGQPKRALPRRFHGLCLQKDFFKPLTLSWAFPEGSWLLVVLSLLRAGFGRIPPAASFHSRPALWQQGAASGSPQEGTLKCPQACPPLSPLWKKTCWPSQLPIDPPPDDAVCS